MAVTRVRPTPVEETPDVEKELADKAGVHSRTGQKKRRVRVGPGPWDAAPCTHLRWHLMGFFREKLVLVKVAGGPTELQVRCTKCSTEMTLQAK